MFWFCLVIFLLLLIYVILCFYLSQSAVPLKFDGAHIIITGGSSGIGLELALELTKRGSNVTILARDQEKLKTAHSRMNEHRKSKSQNLLWFACDVASFTHLSSAIKSAAEANGQKIDVLICSAGVTNVTRFLESPPSHIESLMNINFNGCAYATYLVAPFMKAQKTGRIIFVSSLLGLMGCPSYSIYSASKYALKGFAESLQCEFASFNIFFSVATPSNVLTPMFEAEEKLKSPETREIEKASGQAPVTPVLVSSDIIKSLEKWRFLITTGTDPWLVSNITAGFSPASFTELLTQPFIASIGRLVAMWEIKKMRNVCQRIYK